MRYRLTCLTPLLVGSGDRLSPIDYMVWRNQVNVLDQNKIFRLLAKGPRLESYLSQIKRTDKLDFASWGGFAQNFADRRIQFEHESLTGIWENTHSEHLFIPTFAASPSGPYVPGAAIKGALRTALLYDRWKEGLPKQVVEAYTTGYTPRSSAKVEEVALSSSGRSPARAFAVGDSGPVPRDVFRIFLTRVASLSKQTSGGVSLGWKVASRGSVAPNRIQDSTPTFAEMAIPNSTFEGDWDDKTANPDDPERAKNRKGDIRTKLFAAANRHASRFLDLEDSYAESAGLNDLRQTVSSLRAAVEEAGSEGACVLNLGWGGGLLGKVAWIGADQDRVHSLMEQIPVYSKALRPGLPFPKTRRVVFLGGQPASLPGWVKLTIAPEEISPSSPA